MSALYPVLSDGDALAVKPGEILRLACCDCGLVHNIAFAYEDGEIGIALKRNKRATGQRRRWMKARNARETGMDFVIGNSDRYVIRPKILGTKTIGNDDPYLHIDAGEKQHVYPLAYFRSLLAGEPVDPLPADVLRVIVAEWLECLHAERGA